jgi:ribonuclease HII
MGRVKFDLGSLPPRPDLSFETALWAKGVQFIAGIDEAGRGALAGPVAAAAVILPADMQIARDLAGVRDSKEMTPTEREFWASRIYVHALGYGVGYASHEEIDCLGIAAATRLAMRRAVDLLSTRPQYLLVDFVPLPEIPIPQTSLVKGDARSLSIASASVLAKTGRDQWMRRADIDYPAYGFAQHKGYGTLNHRRVLARLGPCPLHRSSFKTRELTKEEICDD